MKSTVVNEGNIMGYKTAGKHIIADFWNLRNDDMYSDSLLLTLVIASVQKTGAHIISVQYCTFEPVGLTILIFLEESHFSLHTYPEKKYIAIDCYTCGETEPEKAIHYLADILKPQKTYIKQFLRGDGSIKEYRN